MYTGLMGIVELSNISKVYQMDNVQVNAVKNASFSIQQGEFAAISGPSGSGKSTLLNIIGLTDLPTSGTLIINGNDIYKNITLGVKAKIPSRVDSMLTDLRRSQLGFIFQTINMVPLLNVWENI